ncbi:MAG TPA: hypothetical protein VEI97_19465, partial [bacterium]|nr:hypothetical protein [bacterium]
AIIAKYIDPRGGNNAAEKRANRLPKSPADVRAFVYRMPYGAIDAELVRPLGETGGLVPNNIVSSTTVRFHVRDWDARATESTQPDLKDELNPSLVNSGSSGVPTVQVDVPGVTATPALLNLVDDDTAEGGDAAADSGVARDPLYYTGVVQNSAASGGGQTAGPRKGLLKAEDPENLLDRSAYEFALDPSLTPLASNKPELVTYQAFTVSLGGGPANDPPTATVALAAGTNPTVASGGALDFLLTSEFDTENDAVTYSVDITNDGTFELTDHDPATAPPPDVLLYAGTAPTNTGAAPVPHTARVTYKDPTHPASTILLDYSVNPAGANTPPSAVVNLLCSTTTSGTGLVFQLASESDPDGDTVTYQIDYDFTGTFTPDAGPIDPPNAAPPALAFHTSPPQTNPGSTTLMRTARVRYTDGVTAPINIDLPYDLGPNTCPPQQLSWNFDADLNGWLTGETFSYGPALNNGDLSGWGHLRQGCTTSATEARVGVLSGGYITSGDDGDYSACSFMYDYGRQADYNVVSPHINVPALCLPGSLKLRFDGVLFARPAGTVNVYVSTDVGATWGTPVWTLNATGSELVLNNQTICLPDSLAGQGILVRFQFQDTTDTTYGLPSPYNTSSNAVALTVDNVEILGGAATPFNTNPPVFPCAPRNRTYDFTAAEGWQGGQTFGLPNGDTYGSGTPNAGGWGSFRWTDCQSTTGTYGAVVTAAGGLITGRSLNVSNDGTGSGCGSYLRDYGANANFNVVSPRILVPPSCTGADTVTLSWKAYLNTDDGNYQDTSFETCSTCGGEDGPDMTVVVRAYLSIDNGATWGTPIWSANTTLAGQTFNVAVPVNSLAGLASGVRVRFEFVSTA